MLENFKLNKKSAIAFAVAITAVGVAVMSSTGFLATASQQETSTTVVKAEDTATLSAPGAGIGRVLDNYMGATSGSSIELLSTTAIAASIEDSYNEYYDSNGSAIGKLIVYAGADTLEVFDKVKGYERIENGEEIAKVVGYMNAGDVATLVREQGSWYQIISGEVTGYVKTDGFQKGIEAENSDPNTYIYGAYANEDGVFLYEEAYEASPVLCLLPSEVRYTMVEQGDEYTKVNVPQVGEGWVKNDQLTVSLERRYAKTVAYEIQSSNRIEEGITAAEELAAGIAAELAAAAAGTVSTFDYSTISIAPAAPDSEDTAALRQAIANYAQQFVGVLPYIWGSSDLSYGADCSGFTSAIYRAYGIEISRSSDAQAWGGTSVSLDDIRPGDIIAYPGHVALYIGNGTVVHESVPGTTASYADMYMMPIINVVRYIN